MWLPSIRKSQENRKRKWNSLDHVSTVSWSTNLTSEWKQVYFTNFGHESDLISMCQRCSSSLCLFSTAFCFCFFSLLSCSFLARLLGLISTGSSGFTFFYGTDRGEDRTNVSVGMWWQRNESRCTCCDDLTSLKLKTEKYYVLSEPWMLLPASRSHLDDDSESQLCNTYLPAVIRRQAQFSG